MSVEEDACAGNDLFAFLRATEHFPQRVAAAAKLHFAEFVGVRCAAHEDARSAAGPQHGALRDGERAYEGQTYRALHSDARDDLQHLLRQNGDCARLQLRKLFESDGRTPAQEYQMAV
jgi:hypothetical protein